MAFIRGTGGGGYSTNSYSISTGTIAHEVKKLSQATHTPNADPMAQQYQQTGTVNPVQFVKAVAKEAASNPYISEPLKAFMRLEGWDLLNVGAVKVGNWLGGAYSRVPQGFTEIQGWSAEEISRRIGGNPLGAVANRVVPEVVPLGNIFGATQLAGGSNPRPGSYTPQPTRLDADLAGAFMRNEVSYKEARSVQETRNQAYTLQPTREQQLIDYASRQAPILLETNRLNTDQRKAHERALSRMGFLR